MINILIRTHDRFSMLQECIKSIERQSYKDWNIIISVDNKHTANKVESLSYEFVRTNKITYRGLKKGLIRGKENRLKRKKRKIYWNLYFNTLQDMAKEGIILYLDEDMVLASKNSLQLIADNSHEDEVLIFKYGLPGREGNGSRPTKSKWEKPPKRGTISTGCFSHHSKYKARWLPQKAGDYYAVSNLYGRLKSRWLDKIITKGQDI